ncbi:Transcriptional regulator, TetR family [Nonomuraea coxensis DSM 45129]|uniref:Transcriptional regulator, TetR family n=1 Tax=Nonomuraea coxensis DSM 45129 TaxID=1122611 RepID=A0ABX8U9U4_9ACTN|nr:TetR family transcriptional regulator [Nonomuraea coxensis]QYC44524.1 Transcriptional regulator, TetR family [Nonomuraea coxensis DSM 45129]
MPDESLGRILDAAYAGMLEQGLRRLTMDDVARRAGLARITVYRRFARKSELIEAVLLRELRRFLRAFEQELAPLPTAAERVVEGFAVTLRLVRAHPLLTRLLATEPETILPQLTVEAGPYLAVARRYLAERLRTEGARADAVAETYVRIALSFVLTPAGVVPLRDDEDARAYARRHLVPLLRPNLPTEGNQLEL